MRLKPWSLYRLALAISLAQSPIFIETAQAACLTAKFDKQCPAPSGASFAAGGGGVAAGAGQLVGVAAAQGASHAAYAAKCRKAYESCTTQCKEDSSRCQKYQTRAEAGDGAAQQAGEAEKGANKTGEASGSMDPMAAGLLGALAGMAGAMMAQKNKKKEEPVYDGALQANGTIDCSKADAYDYSACNDHMLTMCSNNMDDTRCQPFSARYCGGGGLASSPGGMVAGNPAIIVGAVGEGAGSRYCKKLLAWNFCKTGGTERCPSCLQLMNELSTTCQSNPVLCMAQNSPEQTAMARQTCPGDPIFSDPAYVAGGGGANVSVNNSNLPPPVLPQQDGLISNLQMPVTGTNTSGAAGGGVSSGLVSGGAVVSGVSANTGGVSTFSTASADLSAGRAAREAYVKSGYGAGAAGGSGSGTGTAAKGFGSGNFHFAGGEKERVAHGSGPAPDVQGRFGPSVFSVGTQALRARCEAGKLLNCP